MAEEVKEEEEIHGEGEGQFVCRARRKALIIAKEGRAWVSKQVGEVMAEEVGGGWWGCGGEDVDGKKESGVWGGRQHSHGLAPATTTEGRTTLTGRSER